MGSCKFARDLAEATTRGHNVNPSLPSRAVASQLRDLGYTTGRASVTDHRRGSCTCTKTYIPKSTPAEAVAGESETHNHDGSASYTRFSMEPWGYEDYRAFIASTGQDPDAVTFTWGWTSNPNGGFWNKLNNVRPKATAAAGIDVENIVAGIRDWAPTHTVKSGRTTDPVTLVVGMADWQLGKGEGDGTRGTVTRLGNSLVGVIKHVYELRDAGHNLDHVVLANMGDHTENVAGSYANQTHTVDLNLRDQITLAIELNLQWVKALAPLFPHVTYAAALCNHGQMTRGQGRDNITDDTDNATGLIGDTLRTICNTHPDLKGIEWVVPRDEMITRVTASGVNLPLAHGHKITGKEEDWLAKQSQYLTRVHRFIPDVWFTAHKHHAALTDFGPYTRIQATTVDPGSKWLTDSTGMYSRPGTTTFLVGDSLPGKWSHHRIH